MTFIPFGQLVNERLVLENRVHSRRTFPPDNPLSLRQNPSDISVSALFALTTNGLSAGLSGVSVQEGDFIWEGLCPAGHGYCCGYLVDIRVRPRPNGRSVPFPTSTTARAQTPDRKPPRDLWSRSSETPVLLRCRCWSGWRPPSVGNTLLRRRHGSDLAIGAHPWRSGIPWCRTVSTAGVWRTKLMSSERQPSVLIQSLHRLQHQCTMQSLLLSIVDYCNIQNSTSL